MTFTPPGSTLPGRVRRRALLRRLLPRLHLGHAAERRRPARARRGSGSSAPAPRCRSTSSSGPAATSTTPTLRRHHQAHPLHRRATSRRAPVASATATNGDDAAGGARSTRAGRATPTPATRSTYAWDLDGDGAFDDATAAHGRRSPISPRAATTSGSGSPTTTAPRATDHGGRSPPATRRRRPTIASPTAGLTWKVGDPIAFAGRRRPTAQDGALPAAALSWSLRAPPLPVELPRAHACRRSPASTSGSFAAPDHEYPSYLELRLTATDSGGLTDTRTDPARSEDRRPPVRVQPEPDWSWPQRLPPATAPFTRT